MPKKLLSKLIKPFKKSIITETSHTSHHTALSKHIKEVLAKSTRLFSKEDIEHALDKLAYEISESLGDKNPVFLCVLSGGIIPLGNLLPRLDFPLEVNYVHASRYGSKTYGSRLKWKAKPTTDLNNRTVVVVDDILDEGVTLAAIVKYCKKQGANEVYTTVLIDKIKKRDLGGLEKADFVGLEIEDVYVFGYGLDYKEYLRNAPGIYVVAKEHQ